MEKLPREVKKFMDRELRQYWTNKNEFEKLKIERIEESGRRR